MDPHQSLPVPITAKFAAMAAAVPPLEPPVTQRRIVRVACLATQRTGRDTATTKLVKIRLAENNRPCVA